MYLVIIEGDWNDGDSVYAHYVMHEEGLQYFKSLYKNAQDIRKKLTEQFPETGKCHRDKLIRWDNAIGLLYDDNCGLATDEVKEFFDFWDYCPRGYEQPIHTIDSIAIYKLAEPDPEYIDD